jgi:hypothetical protein
VPGHSCQLLPLLDQTVDLSCLVLRYLCSESSLVLSSVFLTYLCHSPVVLRTFLAYIESDKFDFRRITSGTNGK